MSMKMFRIFACTVIYFEAKFGAHPEPAASPTTSAKIFQHNGHSAPVLEVDSLLSELSGFRFAKALRYYYLSYDKATNAARATLTTVSQNGATLTHRSKNLSNFVLESRSFLISLASVVSIFTVVIAMEIRSYLTILSTQVDPAGQIPRAP